MDILNSGSFVPLDNRERMEQLAFTAKTLATEVSRAEGFQSSGATNQQLGLEMWQGAEYVCRAHEEATIRNLFLSKFLETLRAIEKQNACQPRPPQAQFTDPQSVRPSDLVHPQSTTPIPETPPGPLSTSEQSPPSDLGLQQKPQEPADEYLGVVSHHGEIETKRPSYSDECVPECDADIEAIEDKLDDEHQEPRSNEYAEPIGTISEQAEIVATRNVACVEAESSDDCPTPEPNFLSKVLHEEIRTDIENSLEPSPIESLVIHEKEPYNFDGCTVTVVVQLLPEAKGARKCVVSVRTHDFTPRVAIVDMTMDDIPSQISEALGVVFKKYRKDLPARAAEKTKKEKPATKKVSKSPAKASKPAAPVAKSEAAAAEQNQQGLFSA